MTNSGSVSTSRIPRLVLAGTQSGVGKTSITLGLVSALKRRGLRVQTFKSGPDFLDPTYLKIASGRECYNLDVFMMGREYVERLFASACEDAEIAIVEGAMGLFDGFSTDTSEGSCAEIAKCLNAPVVLVINAGGIARSAAAIVKGFVEFESGMNIAGVIANHVGSANHTRLLADSMVSLNLPPLLGGIRKNDPPKLPERHLGLFTAGAESHTFNLIEELGNIIEKNIDMDALVEVTKSAHANHVSGGANHGPNKVKGRLGVAIDKAFHFYYPDNLKALEQGGLEIVPFSPVTDTAIPDGVNALYFGGGYPEESAGELSANRSMLNSVRRFANAGGTVYAECGGLIYLSKSVENLDGKKSEFAGLLPVGTKMRNRFTALGYVDVAPEKNSPWRMGGGAVRGHRFHYSELESDPAGTDGWNTAYTITRKRTGESSKEGYYKGNTLLSYAHLHLASNESALKSFINFCVGEKTE